MTFEWRKEIGQKMMLWYILSATAGIAFVFQQAVNSELRIQIGSPWWAGFVSYLGGTLVMLFVALALREPLPGDAFARAPWLSWTGGLFGAIYIAISILMLPRLGATTTVALIVLGQMTASLAFDHYGFLGVDEHPLSMARIAGVAMIVLGVALTRL
jgi:bacterial/archaeal transporter family-2 protein